VTLINFVRFSLEFLLRPTSADESRNPTTISTTSNDADRRRDQISKLVELGFTDKQARTALKRTRYPLTLFKSNNKFSFDLIRYDLHTAMDLILTQPDILDDDDDDDDDDDEQNQSNENDLSVKFTYFLFAC